MPLPRANERGVCLIVPCYNAEAFIGEALESALGQTVPPDEILVVDDGSTDSSTEVVRGFGARVRLVHQENAGEPSARNRGILETHAPLIAFLDADDLWTPCSLEWRLDLLEANPAADYAFGRTEQFIHPGSAAVSVLQPLAPVPLPSATLFRRRAFDAAGLFDPAIRLGAMMDWYSRARHCGLSEVSTEAVVLRRRVHDRNSVHDTARLRQDYLRALRSAARRNRIVDR